MLKFRREFDQYVNLRPVRLLPVSPRRLRAAAPGDIDFYIVRENTEGEYSSIGGRMFAGTEREVVIQENGNEQIGVDRVLKFAFDLAQSRPKKHLDFSNEIERHLDHHALLDERVEAMARSYPDLRSTNSISTS